MFKKIDYAFLFVPSGQEKYFYNLYSVVTASPFFSACCNKAAITLLAGDCNKPITSPISSFLVLIWVSVFRLLSPIYTSPLMNAAFNTGISPLLSLRKEVIINAGSLGFSENISAVTL